MWLQKAADGDFEDVRFRVICSNGTPEEVWRLKNGFAQWRLGKAYEKGNFGLVTDEEEALKG